MRTLDTKTFEKAKHRAAIRNLDYLKLKIPSPVSIFIGNEECSCVMVQDSFSFLKPNVNLLVI